MKRQFWWGMLGLNAIIIVFFWLQNSSDMFSLGFPGIAVALGRAAGLFAAYFILLQFFLMGRNPLLEGVFGLDKLAKLHQKTGKIGLIVLLFHPFLLVVGRAAFREVGWWNQFMAFATGYEDVFAAIIGLALFVVVVIMSLTIVRMRLRYETWYVVHLTTYLAVFLSFGHQLEVGSDLLASRLFYGYWIALYTLVLGSHLVFRFIRPLYRLYRHRFNVTRIERESPDAVSIYISGNDLNKFPVRPGQFMILRFLAKGFWTQAHPFSLSMVPNGTEIRVTVKELGDFTKTVSNVPIGTTVFIDGPYGVFTDLFSVSNKALLIAGGIGITPIRSLAEEMLAKGKDVVILYGNKTERDIVFKKEIDALQEKYPARVVHILSNEPTYTGPHGYVDKEKIREFVPDVRERDVYICGPIPMMDGLVKSLREMGTPQTSIHYEKFAL